jgi:adenine-specific DNA-methyltransferase
LERIYKAKSKAKKAKGGTSILKTKKNEKKSLIEISNAFDQKINDPDYARKLYLIENCIYGVDIQPIATQISKLRFLSLWW